MEKTERDNLIEEKKLLEEKVKKADFIDPEDVRRIGAIVSLLLSDGITDSLRLSGKKQKELNRVTSFTRDRR